MLIRTLIGLEVTYKISITDQNREVIQAQQRQEIKTNVMVAGMKINTGSHKGSKAASKESSRIHSKANSKANSRASSS